jgi:putative phosphoribosyl transferase
VDAERRTVRIPAGGVELEAEVVAPRPGRAVVAFAHGAGSSRHSPRNQYVAGELSAAGLGTVLADLLTPDEERVDAVDGRLRFDIGLLAQRLTGLVDWLSSGAPGAGFDTDGSGAGLEAGLPVGLFGASTGAAAALVTAAERPGAVAAVVSRGGRPDLAGPALPRVPQPTLLIVGGDDPEVIDLNENAQTMLAGPNRLEVVPGATHLFEEPGALEQVAALARAWFATRLLHSPSDEEPPSDQD